MGRRPARFENPEIPDEALDPGELGRRNFLRAAGVFGVSMSLGVASVTTSSRSSASAQTATVRGLVFDDRGRRGIQGVAVSDGEAIAVTDARGRYNLTVNPNRRTTGIVFVTTPPGWSAPPDADMIPGFYRPFAVEAGAETTVDFRLRRDARGADVNYRFLAAADPHVRLSGGFPFDPDPLGRWRGQIRQFNDIISGAEDADTAPRFLTVAGDVTQIGVPDEFDAFRAGTRDSIVPVWPVLGNHDYPLAGLGVPQNPDYDSVVDGYRRALGPEWYSFTYGNQHFVVLDNMIGIGQPDQLRWLRTDLALHAADRDVVLMFHAPFAEKDWWLARYFPDQQDSIAQAYLDVLEPYSVQLMLSGHAHVNRVDRVSRPGTLHVNTNSSYYSLDNSPLGFRLLTVQAEREIQAPFRMYGVPFVVTQVHPAAGSRVPSGTTTAQVSTYNTLSKIASVRFRVDDGPWHRMSPSGDWTWSAQLDAAALGKGRHVWEVDVRDATNRRQTASTGFDVVGSLPEPATGATWPMFHGAAARGGFGVDAVVPPLRLAWSYRTEGTILLGSPAIASDTVYIGIRDENDVAACATVAINLTTGDERWRVAADSLVDASPAVVDGRVFTTSVAGQLQALDASSGDVLWEHHADGGDPLAYPKAYSSPAAADGVVVNLHQITGGASVLAARDVESGEERWAYAPGSLSVGTSSKPVAISDGRVYFTAGNTFIVQPPRAVDLATGQQVWEARPADVGGDNEVRAGQGPVVCARNTLLVNYVDAASQGPNAVLAFDVTSDDSPNELWRFVGPQQVLADANLHGTAPAVDADTVYATFPSGFVVALDLTSGAERWRHDLGAALLSSPAISGGVLYVGSNDGRLSALDRRTGDVVWSFKVSAAWVASSPAVSGNTVVVGCWDGNVYALTAEA